MEANQLGRLQDILDAARLVASYVKDATELDFASDTEKQDAVIRRIVAHNYANVDLCVVWEVATVHVPVVRAVLEKFFAGREQPPETPGG